jgi:VanZ family protein
MNKIIRFLPAIFWMGIIFYFSSRSTSSVPISYQYQFLFFKSLHLIEYGILGILLFYALSSLPFTLLIAYLYALSDEIHQYFIPGRGSKFTDTLFDLAGIILGIFLFKFINQLRISRK